MPSYLEVQVPGGTRLKVDLKGAVSIGRSSSCDIPLAYKGVSRHHATIEPAGGGGWNVLDNQSRNGTWVNGERIGARRPIQAGDAIKVGPVHLVLREVHDWSDATGEATLHTLPKVDLRKLRPSHELEDPEQIAEKYDTLRAAYGFTERIGLERDPERIARALLDFCFDTLTVDNGAVLIRARGGDLQPVVQRTVDGRPMQVSSTIISRLESTRQSMWIVDAQRDQRVLGAHSVMDLGIKSVLAVPLLVGDDILGIVVLDNRTEHSAFRMHDLHVLGGIASAAAMAWHRGQLLEEIQHEALQRERLARLVAPEVADQIMRGQLELATGGQEATISILFCDLRSFTPMSRRLGPQRTLERLNAWFRVAVDEVRAHGGVVDKFVGDEVMAMWGVPVARPDDAERALRCALGLRRRLAELPTEGGEEPLTCGIGVHRGAAIVGLLGSDEQVQFTAIGDTVNLCSRLCSIARPGQILVHEAALEGLDGFETEALPPREVRGIDEPVAMQLLHGVH